MIAILKDSSARLSTWIVGAALLAAPAHAASLRAVDMGLLEPAVMAHRGASGLEPESSPSSYKLATSLGADYLEGDLHLSADGVLVVNHDDTFARTTNVAEAFPGRENEPVSAFTWAEIQKLRHRGRMEEKVLRLEQLLDLARADPFRSPGVYLEAKMPVSGPDVSPRVAEAAVRLLKERGWIQGRPDDGKRVVLQAFSPLAAARFKQLAPTVPLTLLVDQAYTARRWKKALEIARAVGADGMGARFYPWAVRRFAAMAHASGLYFHPWGVNGRLAMRFVRWLGADGFFTDRIDLASRR